MTGLLKLRLPDEKYDQTFEIGVRDRGKGFHFFFIVINLTSLLFFSLVELPDENMNGVSV
ncbi:hypothetical protein C1646_764957 [Rhizophagus diaphanus]|nr:hypothetical protein C1646_764957 [Rhizophagus diaphanus] [Rhizophagus sp. MUCL 43196]